MELAVTTENRIMAKALESVKQTDWNGNTVHTSMQACLKGINLQTLNSGHYNPSAVRLPRVKGWFMVNQDGGLYFEARIIKEDDAKFRIEYLSNSGYDTFDNKYRELL